MILPSDSIRTFGEMHFGNAQLGDKKRTKRLVYCADRLCQHPGGTFPEKFKSPSDLKAFYRLCNREEVTHEAVLKSHRDHVLSELHKAKSIDVMIVPYPDLISNPTYWSMQIAVFAGKLVRDPDKMSTAVRPDLYRNRSNNLQCHEALTGAMP